MTGYDGAYVFMHTEDYSTPLLFYPVIRFAHAVLHQRFTDPLPWNRLVRKHYIHGAWFTLLTMDPADMSRPFKDVYPNGLPEHAQLWPEVADQLGIAPTYFATTAQEVRSNGLQTGNPWRLAKPQP